MNVACIPAFNSEKTIGGIVKECLIQVDKVLVCDDGSMDKTAKIAEENGADVLKHQKNYGYGAALITLFEKARDLGADYVITLDADGQHIPELIPRLLAPLSYDNNDVVIGSRFLKKSKSPRYGKTGMRVITSMTNMGHGLNLTDAKSGFRAYSKKAIQEIHPTEYGMQASTEILTKAINKGFTIVEIPIVITYETSTSKARRIPGSVHTVMNILKYLSIQHPIVSFGIPGLILIGVGIILAAIFLDTYLNRNVVFVGTLLASIMLFLAGVVLTTTSILLFSFSNMLRDRY